MAGNQNSGGRRQGRPGRKYPNRSDMRQAPKAVPGQTYGAAKQQLDAQKVIPLPTTPGPSAAAPSSGAAALAGTVGGGGMPVVPLDAPSTRPNEPITHGLPTGAGGGPEALNLPPQMGEDQNILATLRGLYQAYPSSDIAGLIAELDARG